MMVLNVEFISRMQQNSFTMQKHLHVLNVFSRAGNEEQKREGKNVLTVNSRAYTWHHSKIQALRPNF